MGEEKTLTKEIAEQFLAESSSVNLSDFSSMEDAAAHVFSEDQSRAKMEHIGPIALNGLTSLSLPIWRGAGTSFHCLTTKNKATLAKHTNKNYGQKTDTANRQEVFTGQRSG